jgi:hypothetical protein
MGSCLASQRDPEPIPFQRPVEVPCRKCGVINYLDARKSAASCFKCGEICSRYSRRAEAVKSTSSMYDLSLAENGKEKLMNAASCGIGG